MFSTTNCLTPTPKFSLWQSVLLEWTDGNDTNRYVCTVTGIVYRPQQVFSAPVEWAYQVEWSDGAHKSQEVVPQEDLQEVALPSEVYRGHCIVIYRSGKGWAWAFGGVGNQAWNDSTDTYPNRSKARLEARRAILRSGAQSAIWKVQ